MRWANEYQSEVVGWIERVTPYTAVCNKLSSLKVKYCNMQKQRHRGIYLKGPQGFLTSSSHLFLFSIIFQQFPAVWVSSHTVSISTPLVGHNCVLCWKYSKLQRWGVSRLWNDIVVACFLVTWLLCVSRRAFPAKFTLGASQCASAFPSFQFPFSNNQLLRRRDGQ